MKIVKISELSEEERKKALEKQEQRYQRSATNRKVEVQSANRLFNDNIEKKGKKDNSDYSTTINTSNVAQIATLNSNNTDKILPLYVDDFQKDTSNDVQIATINRNNTRESLPYVYNANEQKTNMQNVVLPYGNINNTTISNNVKETDNVEKNANVLEDVPGMLQNLGAGARNGLNQSMNFNTQVNKGYEGYNNITNKLALNKYLSTPITERNKEYLNKNFIEEYLKENTNKNNEIISNNTSQMSNNVTKKISELAPSVGQMGVGGVLGSVNPVLGTGYFFTSSGGSYYDDAISRGMTHEQALKQASIMGAVEAATEQVGLENFKKAGQGLKTLITGAGKEVTERALETVAKNEIKSSVKDVLKQYGVGIADNFIQEAIITPIQEVSAYAIGGEDTADFSNLAQRMLQDGIDGALVSAIVGGANLGVNSCTAIIEKSNNGQTITQQEYKQALKDAQEKGINIEQEIKENMQTQINKLNLQQNQPNNTNNLQTQQTTGQGNKVAENPISEQTEGILNNKKLPMQSYQYEKSDNVKINNLRQDANRYFNNSEKARNYVSMLEKIITDKNIEIRLDGNLKTADGRIANGSYSNGVITINPNSNSTGEFIAIHELTHAIGTKEMLNMINTYRNSNPEFDTAVKGLLKNYQGTEISEEALSDISGQLFGNQEFINNIAQNNPNIFQKIYSEIKYLWHQFRGYKNQNQFVEDLYYKWTQAYNSNNKLNETSNYYIETVADFNEIEYNNAKELKLPKREYAILSGIVNSDSNIKPGINYVETTNATYEVYFKETGEFKVVGKIVDGGYNDTITNGNIQGIGSTGNAKGGMQVHSSTIQQSRTGARNDEISNFNQKRTRISDKSIGNGSSNSSNVKYSIQESENNSGSFSMPKEIQNIVFNKEFYDRFKYEDKNTINETIEDLQKQKELLKPDENDLDWDKNFEINQKIKALKNGYDSVYDYLVENEKQFISKDYKYNPQKYEKILEEYKKNIKKQGKLQKEIDEAEPLKRTQYEIIQKTNPMFDDEHVGIRSPADIKTFEEVINDEESFSWGDYSKEDALKDLKRNKVRIYSSYAIKNGTFVSTSYQQALDYAGGDRTKVHSKEVSPSKVAWINGDEGQYASTSAKYSKNNQSWQQYLDENYKPTGTRTNLQDIKLPTKQNTTKLPTLGKTIQEVGAPIRKTESNLEKYNKYKKNILDSRAKEVNNLISYKNETIRNIENKIAEKEALLNSKKDKNTKTASVLRIQIENLKTRQKRIENLYNEKIDKVNSKTNRDKINFETRNMIKKEARENLKAEISPLTADLTKYKDKKAGFLFNRETAQRNIDDIVKDKDLAQAIKETIFDPVQVHQAQKNREVNELFNKINELNLDKTKKYNYVVEDNTINGEKTEEKKNIKIDEATLAQLLIEKKLTNQDLKNNYNMSNEQIQKINQTANTFTEILDYLYNKMNEEQIKYGYSPIGKINNYFPHFFENKPDTMLGKIASYFGIDITNQNLPTEIAGKTDIFKPGKTWNSNTLQRKTNKTDYDALKAMEKYIQGATDIIYTTEDIQKIREYERQIRYKYSDKGIQEEIDKIINNNELTQEAKDSALEGIFKNTENELSNFVTWLNDYGNTLANKKSFSDRNMEREIGRNLYSSMSGIESRIASNTIGGNLSVSLTNFAPLFQAAGTTKMNYLLTGMLQTTANNIRGMTGNKSFDFVDNSNFLTNRFGTASISEKTVTQKISDVASIPMNAIDEFTAESIVRGKYLENINKGMTEEKALDNADKYASKIMADRSKGALPLIFNAKNPISKLTTMFQVEPNNIISNYLKDMPREATSKAELTKQATKLMVASYAFNTLVMAIRGGNEVLPDTIRWVSYLIKAIAGDDDEKEQAKTDLMESIIGSVPFASNVAGLFGFEDIGRVPISNAMPNLANIAKAFDNEADSEYRKETAMKELLKPFIYLGLPTGGAQLKKTIEGIETVSEGGSYKTDKEGNKILQFPVEDANVGDYIKAGALGKYSLPMAKEYQDRNFKSLTAKQTKTYEEAQLPYKEYLNYIDADLKTKEDKINYLSEQKWTENQKWGIYTNDIFSSTQREKDGGSQLEDAKYITSNGISKSEYIEIYNKAQKNNIDMPTEEEYKEIKSNAISLKTYIDYKINTKNIKKDNEKIEVLIDSNYTDKEKQTIYENYIKTQTKEGSFNEFDVIKASNININEYLKYEQQEFVSDTTDDGTLNGKTISGSKKEKVVEYLNDMKITGNQRLLLYAMQGYGTTSSQKTQLSKYVDSLDLSKEDKLNLYNKFSGFTVYKDGRVTW